MKFIVDAQLPKKLSLLITDKGFESVHTLDLPNANSTTDNEINLLSVQENRVVITKDIDFYNSFVLSNIPYKLILVTTGNISNKVLLELFSNKIDKIAEYLSDNSVIEVNTNQIIIRI